MSHGLWFSQFPAGSTFAFHLYLYRSTPTLICYFKSLLPVTICIAAWLFPCFSLSYPSSCSTTVFQKTSSNPKPTEAQRPSWEKSSLQPWNRKLMRCVSRRYLTILQSSWLVWYLPPFLFVSKVSHHHLSTEAHEEQVQIHRGDATDEEGEQQPDIYISSCFIFILSCSS